MKAKKKKQFTFFPYGKPYVRNNEKVKASFDNIFEDLENHGRAFTEDGKASRKLSNAMQNAKENGYIRFVWDKTLPEKRSTIVLKPGIKLKRVSDKKIRLVFTEKTKVLKRKKK